MTKPVIKIGPPRPTTLNDYCKECNKIARAHGWWEKPRSPLEIAALMMSELGEFVEAVRSRDNNNAREELADVFIRLADYCGEMRIDLDTEVSNKMEKNRSRPYRHGGKTF